MENSGSVYFDFNSGLVFVCVQAALMDCSFMLHGLMLAVIYTCRNISFNKCYKRIPKLFVSFGYRFEFSRQWGPVVLKVAMALV